MVGGVGGETPRTINHQLPLTTNQQVAKKATLCWFQDQGFTPKQSEQTNSPPRPTSPNLTLNGGVVDESEKNALNQHC